MKKKNITIDVLAGMVQKGFMETSKKVEVDNRFDKVDNRFDEVDNRFDDVKSRFVGVNRRFDAVDDRLDRIEKLILADHKKRIERLEVEVKELKELLAVK